MQLTLVLISTLALLAPGATGQQRPAKKTGSGDPPTFEFDPAARTRRDAARPVRLTPQDAMAEALPSLVTWPAASGESAARALAARGPEMLEVLRTSLRLGTVREKLGAARCLCLLQDRESLQPIEELFLDRRLRYRATPLLLSVADLDAKRAQELSLKFLDNSSAALRKASMAFLRADADPALLDEIRQCLVGTELADVRVAAFQLLEEFHDPELPLLSLEWVGHRQARLAALVAEFLSWRQEPEVRAKLVDLAQQDRDRAGPHAWIILAAAERHYGEAALPDALFEELLSETRSSDPLLRSAAAIGCATIGYRREDLAEVTREKVLPALAELVVRGRYFDDHQMCFRNTVAMLEQLTGQRLGEDVPAWRAYWSERGGELQQTRGELRSIRTTSDPASCVIRLEVADRLGRFRESLHLVGQNYRVQLGSAEFPQAFLVPIPKMRDLLQRLAADGYFRSTLPREVSSVEPGTRRLSIEARGRERGLVARPGEESMNTWVATLEDAAWPLSWQLLLARNDRFLERFDQEEAWWEQNSKESVCVARLIELCLQELREAEAKRSREILQILERIPGAQRFVTEAQIRGFATLLALPGSRDERQARILEFLVTTDRDAARVAVVNALAEKGERGVDPLADALLRMQGVEKALTDSRPLVRRAGLMAVRTDQFDDLVLRLAQADPDLEVRGLALELSARQADPAALQVVYQEAADENSAVRHQALRALGQVTTPEALEILTVAMDDSDFSVVQAAIEGMGRQRNVAAARNLEGLVRRAGAAETRTILALVVLKGMPSPLAHDSLQRLSESDDESLAQEARYGLADLGVMSVVPHLLADLETRRLHRRAETKLKYLFCSDFAAEAWRYRSLYEAAPEKSHEDYLREALQQVDPDLESGLDLRDPGHAEVLVGGLADQRWFVRRSCLELLEATSGQTLGSLPVNASEVQIQDMMRRWREQLAAPARDD